MGTEDILKKYSLRLRENVKLDYTDIPKNETFSREYEIFRAEALDKTDTFYEKIAGFSGKIIKIKPKGKDYEKLLESIEVSNLYITPEDAAALGVVASITLILIAILVGLVTFLLGNISWGLIILFTITAALLVKPLSFYPNYVANKWRLKASNQMVLCILYVVMYMRHTSNLEHAIKFAGDHIGEPLSLDLRKIFWNVEAGKYSTIKESLDNYLEIWRDHSLEFLEAFHLIEGSLYEVDEARRDSLLDKALEVMLDGTYEKMLHFAHDLKTPITMLHMLGIILPILGLVLFPLVSSFLQGAVKWYHLAGLYNVIIPITVLFFGINMLNKRPTGYGESDFLRNNPQYKTYMKKGPLVIALIVGFVFVFIGALPVILHFTNPSLDQATFLEGSPLGGKFLDYKCSLKDGVSVCSGPYGLGALILSLFIPLGLALSFGIYYRGKTKVLIEVQNKTKKLEREFAGSLFQLGNRVGDGIPIEIAFGDVAKNMEGTPTGGFFRLVNINLRKLGMSVKKAIFDRKRGAIIFYPSALIVSSMKVLIEASKKGPLVVAKSLISISIYVDRIHKVNERLKDLLADILSSMKSQIAFLTPMIAGIVVGVGSMVVTIINKLGDQFSNIDASGVGDSGLGNVAGLASILNIESVIPGYQFQLIVGIFVVQIIFVLTVLSNSIENGFDKLNEKYSLSKNLFLGTTLYFIIALLGVIIFNVLAAGISTISAA